MLVTLAGIVMDRISVQLRKAPFSMLVTLSGITRVCKDVHLEKALMPMLVTPSGITNDCNDVQFVKAFSPMLVIFPSFGSTIDVKLEQFLNPFNSVSKLPSSKMTALRAESLNAF